MIFVSFMAGLRRGKAVASSAQSLSQDDDVCTDLLVDHLHGFQSHKMLQPHEVSRLGLRLLLLLGNRALSHNLSSS